MKAGGYRKVRIKGISDLIPADAVLVVELWMRRIPSSELNRSKC
jgi:hypothetical protein